MPAHRQWQQHHRDEGNDACALAAMTPSQRGCSTFSYFIECRGPVTSLNSTRWRNVPTIIMVVNNLHAKKHWVEVLG
jgi:hypothetical protein